MYHTLKHCFEMHLSTSEQFLLHVEIVLSHETFPEQDDRFWATMKMNQHPYLIVSAACEKSCEWTVCERSSDCELLKTSKDLEIVKNACEVFRLWTMLYERPVDFEQRERCWDFKSLIVYAITLDCEVWEILRLNTVKDLETAWTVWEILRLIGCVNSVCEIFWYFELCLRCWDWTAWEIAWGCEQYARNLVTKCEQCGR